MSDGVDKSSESIAMNLIVSELKDLRKALISAVNKFEDDIGDLYDKVDHLKNLAQDAGADTKTVKALDDWKDDIQRILTIDDLKDLKDVKKVFTLDDIKEIKSEVRKSREFRIRILAYSAVVSLAVAGVFKLVELAVAAHGGK